MTFKTPEAHRVQRGPLASTAAFGCSGAFRIPTRPGQPPMLVIASDALGWEHVSVSRPDRCPTWNEMCAIKALFWDAADCVMQLHPPQSEWISNHPHCLHLWRPVNGAPIPMPPPEMVGIKERTAA